MTRTLKTLGLSLMAVLAFGAVMATAAQANYHQSNAAATVHGVGLEGLLIVHNGANNIAVECFGNEFEIEQAGTKSEGGLTSTELTVHATYGTEGCELAGLGAAVNMGTCHYTFDPPTTLETDTTTAKVSVVCTGAQHITISAAGCTVTVDPQATLEHVVFHNNTVAGDVTATATVHVGTVKTSAGCPGGANNAATGDLEEDITVTATAGTVSVT